MKVLALIFVVFSCTYAIPRKYEYVPTEQFQTEDLDEKVMHADFNEEAEIKPNAIRPEELTKEYWMNHGMQFVERQLNKVPNTKKAKNIILFIGDGMGHTTVAATRAALGNENINLSFEEFPYVASSKTYCVDEQVADSACSATAYLSGVKGNSMTIGVNGNMRWNDCIDTNNRNKYTESIALWAQKAGKATGLVTTTRVTHASPAGVYANTASRYWEDDREVIRDNCDPSTIDDIAIQLVHGEVGSNLNLILGGGIRTFVPNTTVEHGQVGARRDHRNLIDEWLEAKPDRTFVRTRAELEAIDINQAGDVFGLFHSSNLNYNLDAIRLNMREVEPSLAELTTFAIDHLSRKEEGFFLFVEGGSSVNYGIDHAHHATEAKYAVDETIEFAKAIQAVVDKVNLDETLIVVSADHGHVFTYAGYPLRGADIFGLTASNAQDGMRFFTLGYANGPGFSTHRVNNTRVNPNTLDLTNPNLRYPATVPLSSETHAGEDVGIWAIGPWSHMFQGTVEQTVIPHVMAFASCIGKGKTMCDV